MLQSALEGWDLESLDSVFIENVGNLVCPASYDLGEESSRGADVGHGRRRQASQVSDHLQ